MDKRKFQIIPMLLMPPLIFIIGISVRILAAPLGIYISRESPIDVIVAVAAAALCFPLIRFIWRKLGWSLESEDVEEIQTVKTDVTVSDEKFHLNMLPSYLLGAAGCLTFVGVTILLLHLATRNLPGVYGNAYMFHFVGVCAVGVLVSLVLWWHSRTRFSPNHAVSLDKSGAKGRFHSNVKRIEWHQVKRAQLVTCNNFAGQPTKQIIVLRDDNNLTLLELVLSSFEPKDRQRAIAFVQKKLECSQSGSNTLQVLAAP